MSYQHIENLLIRYRGQSISIKAVSGNVYSGIVSDVTNDYVALRAKDSNDSENLIVVLLHTIEAVIPNGK